MSYSTSFFAWTVTMPRRLSIVGLMGVVLIGCTEPAYTVSPKPVELRPLPSTHIYFYPTRGQTPAQQERDRYECYLWAVKQSGFDPGQARLAPHQRIEVTPASPLGSDVVVGAASGAVIGSIVAGRHDRGEGLVFGAVTGGILGAASESEKQEQIQRLEQQYDAMDTQRYARLEWQARNYCRAMSACLEGRGYTVQ